MGGMGSGRWGGAPTKERTGAVILDVHWLTRQAEGAVGWNGYLSVTFRGGAPQRIDMQVELNRGCGVGVLRLRFDVQHFSHRTGPQEQIIALRAIPCPFGGLRWTFICPVRRCQATRLYLPNGGDTFAGRLAYRLGYQSQRGTREDRAWGVIRRVEKRLGQGRSTGRNGKPKWMRWATFDRLCDQRDAANAVLDADIEKFIQRWGV